MKRYIAALLFFFSVVTMPLQAKNTDISALQGGGTYNNVDVLAVDVNANVNISSYNNSGYSPVPHTIISNQGVMTHNNSDIIISPGDLNLGSPTVAMSSNVVSGSDVGIIYSAYLPAGGNAALEGSALSVVAPQLTSGIAVQVTSATFNLSNVIGIAAVATSTASVINFYERGCVFALTTGTVNTGDLLATTSLSAGYLATTTLSTNSIVGMALETGNANGGLTRIKLR